MQRLKLLILAVVVLFSFSSYAPSSHAQDKVDKNQVILDLIMQGLATNHYKDIPIDDVFSGKVYDLYLKRLDYNKRFLTKEDIAKLFPYKNQIDDQVKNSSYEFFDKTIAMFNSRMGEVEGFYKELLSQPFDFSKDEAIETDPLKHDFPANGADLKDTWRKWLKYQALVKVEEQKDRQEKALKDNDTTVKQKSVVEIEKDAREKLIKTHEDWFKRLHKMTMDEQRSIYINAITSTFDPHTNFFPPKDKEDFDISMSGKLEGIGATLQEDNGYIKVTNVVPGSPSWKQGDLKTGDYIIKVAQGSGEPVDIVDMAVDDAVHLIRGKKGTEVRLTIKKVDGTIKTISIIRDVVIIEETYAKSSILQKEGSKVKVGYINLPKFYADFSQSGGRNSGTDVAKEVQKLKAENVNGIIIDLRNNGGGSLQDVVDMGGLFIASGPVVQIKPRIGNAYVLEDKDPAVQYDGPLVILVNSFSASASEILAAAMQDYGRAVIIGSTSFGKGTVQRFFDLDDFVSPELASIKPLGTVKLTTQKFYRINGHATQLKGVTPDILLPDSYEDYKVGEKEEDYPLAWDEINPVRYERWSSAKELQEIKTNSSKRMKTDTYFNVVEQNAKRLKALTDNTNHSLSQTKYHQLSASIQEEAKKYDKLDKTPTSLNVNNLTVDVAHMESDSTKKEMNNKWKNNIKNDHYIDEAFSVISDLTKFPKHPVTNTK